MMQLFIARLNQELNKEDGFHGIIGKSPSWCSFSP